MSTRPSMRLVNGFFVLTILFLAALFSQQSLGGESTDPQANSDPTYMELRKIGLSGERQTVNNLVLKRDVGTFILRTGQLHYLSPVAGKTTGAIFLGEGTFQLAPFQPMERHSLALLTKDSEGVFNEEFSQLVLRFTDETYSELKKSGNLAQETPGARAKDMLGDNQSLLRHTLHYNLDGRILQDILSDQPGGLFFAFVKGKKFSGKMLFMIDPHGVPAVVGPSVEPEEVVLSTYDESKLGLWYSSHFMKEYAAGVATGKQKNGLIDIERQELDTTIERSGKIRGVATTRFVAREAGVRVVPLNLFPSLRVENVIDPSGHPLSFVQEGKDDDPQFAVILPKRLSANESFVIKTTYGGKEAVSNEGAGNYFPVARDNWYPNTRFDDYADYEMTFRVPRGLTMVATGTPVSSTTEGDQNVTKWHSEVPQAVAGFNFGMFKKETATNDKLGFAFESYANKEEPGMLRGLQHSIDRMEQEGVRTTTTLGNLSTTGMMKKALAEAQLSVDLYTNYFGALPYKRIAMTQQTATNFGQSWPTLVYLPITSFFDTTIRHQLGFEDPKGYFKIVGPHEVAHQWWGHAVGFASYRDQWMSEGFAEFSASLFIQLIQKNSKEFIKFWDDEREVLTEKNRFGFRPIDVGPLTMGYRLSTSKAGFDITRRLIYPKGGYVLHMIRMMMWDRRTGDQKFIEMMKDFVKTHANQVATTEDFKAMVEKHIIPDMDVNGNGKMDWFFNEYVYGTALPHYELVHSFSNGPENRVLLKLKITQSNVTDDFVMLVPIYLELADGRVARLGNALMIGNKSVVQEVPLTGLKEKPRRVVLNYYNDVLATP